jgi:predicted DNA-binding ribbon-helix-helix protein
MKSLIRRRSVVINGRKTSVTVEDAFWKSAKKIAKDHGTNLVDLISLIKVHHRSANLSSAIRVFVLEFYREGKLPSWASSSRRQ